MTTPPSLPFGLTLADLAAIGVAAAYRMTDDTDEAIEVTIGVADAAPVVLVTGMRRTHLEGAELREHAEATHAIGDRLVIVRATSDSPRVIVTVPSVERARELAARAQERAVRLDA